MLRRLLDGALILALLSGLLFSAGSAKRHGYFMTLGLNADVLGVDTAAILYSGLINSYLPVLVIAFVIGLAVFFYANALLPLYIDYARGSFERKRKLIRLKRFWSGKRKDTQAEKDAKKMVISFGVVLVLLLLVLIFLAAMENKGRDQAEDLMGEVKRGKPVANATVEIPGKEIGYILLACGSRNCAAMNPLTLEVQYFSQEKGFSYFIE